MIKNKRSLPRTSVRLNISFEQRNKIVPCETVDLNFMGMAIRANSIFVAGDKINIILSDYNLQSIVVRSNGNVAGLRFLGLSENQLNYIKWLCRKYEGKTPVISEKEKVNSGKKVYKLKAETEKDVGSLGIFFSSLKYNCKGLIDVIPLKHSEFQVEIYDIPSSVSSFESLSMLWKVDNLIVS